MKWIKCSECMPTHKTPVLIAADGIYTYGTIICCARYDFVLGYWDCIGSSGFDSENDFETPQYWMPLPELPEEMKETK